MIYLSIMISVQSRERYFTKLKLINTFIRNSMKHEILSMFSILLIERIVLLKENMYEDLINRFGNFKCRQKPFQIIYRKKISFLHIILHTFLYTSFNKYIVVFLFYLFKNLSNIIQLVRPCHHIHTSNVTSSPTIILLSIIKIGITRLMYAHAIST